MNIAKLVAMFDIQGNRTSGLTVTCPQNFSIYILLTWALYMIY